MSLGGSCGRPGVAVPMGNAAGAVPVARGSRANIKETATDGSGTLASERLGTGPEDENAGVNEEAIIPTGEGGGTSLYA